MSDNCLKLVMDSDPDEELGEIPSSVDKQVMKQQEHPNEQKKAVVGEHRPIDLMRFYQVGEEEVFDVAYWPSPLKTSRPIDDWLHAWRPSVLERSNGVGWIWVYPPYPVRHIKESNLVAMEEAWEDLQASGEPIDSQSVTNLAIRTGVTAGKWLFFVRCAAIVDYIWAKVARGIASGNLPHCDCAKISPKEDGRTPVCCIYNNDFSDEEQVRALEQEIRACGIRYVLLYKPDVYTYLKIYGHNKWNINPNIRKSVFDVTTRQSRIQRLE